MQALEPVIERLRRIADSFRAAFENLNERERRLVLALGVVFLLFVTVLPVYLLSSSVATLEEENEALRELMREFGRKEDDLRKIAAERRAQAKRYAQKPPQLSTFVASTAQRFGIEVREFSDQPDKKMDGFQRHHLRVKLPNGMGLRPVMKFLENIENSSYPIAIEKVKIEHYQPGDSYNGIEVDVISFERAGGQAS